MIDISGENFSPNSWLFESKMVSKNPNFYFVLKSVDAADRRGYEDENAKLLREFCWCNLRMCYLYVLEISTFMTA